MLPYATSPAASFLGSERGQVKVQIYNRAGSSFSLYTGNSGVDFDNDDDGNPKLTGCSSNMGLGSGGGFQLSLWLPPGVDPADIIEPDAWVDISFCRGDVCWHVMRGTVEESRLQVSSSGSGVTSRSGSVSGQSFQNCWQSTRIWFNQVNENLGGGSVFKATVSGRINSTPEINVQTILFRLFHEVANTGRANWALPFDMPGARGTLEEVVFFDVSGFDEKLLPRFTPTGQLSYPDGMVWDLATQYMDGTHCELFTDIMPPGGLRALAADPQMASGLSPKDSEMVVAFRDKPFPLVDPATTGKLGRANPWFRLPTWEITWQELRSYSLGTNSREAFNSFIHIGTATPEGMAQQATLRSPLWRIDEMRRRGMRSMDAHTNYTGIPQFIDPDTMMVARRAMLRDWYCMGTELRSGSLTLWRGYPEMKVGGRIRVLGDTPEETMTGYIEGVRHSWSPGSGLATTLSVTRCYFGPDADFLGRLARVSQSYELCPTKLKPG